ncbi:MAG: OmpA family protein [Bacteroidota bacterium]
MKTTFSILVFIFFSGALFSQGTKSTTVYFETNSFELSSNEGKQLNRFLDLFDKSKITGIQLLGHTDSDGEDGFNDRLSENRSKSVSRFLLLHGFRSSNLESFGEKKPVNSNASEDEKARNRRVEVIVNYAKGGLLSDNNYKVLALRNLPTSEYCIDPTRDTILNLKKGGRLIFKANTFSSDGKCVTITAQEAYKKSEIILANLSTTSNGRILESGGMMILEAHNSSGDELQSSKEFTVQMPTDNFLDSMMIFNGEHDADSNLNWTQAQMIDNFLGSSSIGECFDEIGIIVSQQPTCDRCKFFPCRINRIGTTLKGINNQDQKNLNQEFRQCQKRLRKIRRGKLQIQPTPTNAAKDSLCKATQQIMDSLGLKTYKDYMKYRREEYQRQFQEKLKAGKASFNDITMYSMSINSMGYINCDRFYKMPESAKLPTYVVADSLDENTLRETQCSIILKDGKSLIGSRRDGKKFSFINLPKNLAIFVLTIMMKNGVIFLSLEQTRIDGKLPEPNFKAVTFDELQTELQKLD